MTGLAELFLWNGNKSITAEIAAPIDTSSHYLCGMEITPAQAEAGILRADAELKGIPTVGAAMNQSLNAQSPAVLITSEEYRARRDALRKACPDGAILIRGAAEEDPVFTAGNRFRQNSAMRYLTGIEIPGCFLVLLPEGVSASSGVRRADPASREILFLPAPNEHTAVWLGPRPGPGNEIEEATGIAVSADAGSLWSAIMAWIQRCPTLYSCAPYGAAARLSPDYALMKRIRDMAPVVQFKDVMPAQAALRRIKSPAEVALIEQAIAVTEAGQRAALETVATGDGRHEFAVEARVFEAFRSRGALLAFPTIVGAGADSTALHYERNSSLMAEGDLVVVDIGAQLEGYCGDLTRTYPVGGRFTPRQREIYCLVHEAHRTVVEGFRPGEETLESMDARCKAFLQASPLRARTTAGIEQTMEHFMPHRVSHYLGLDVHDVGDTEPALAPGCVVTVEPGIYIAPEQVGVRLENDYLVTETGLRRLGSEAIPSAEDIEASMRS